jgi:hypothetical protein
MEGDVNQMLPPRDISPRSLSPERFHPEFGYLCPTRRIRLKIRMVAILASIGMMVAAISVLALVHREDGASDRREMALPAVAGDEASALILPHAAPAWCQDLPWMILHRQCRSGQSPAARSRRGASRQIVSLPIGRRGVVSANEPAVIVAKVVTSEDETTLGTVTDNAKVPSARLGDSAGSVKKRASKIVRKYKATPPGENGLNAFAAAPWFDRYAHNREATPFPSRDWGAWREFGGIEPDARRGAGPPRK